MGSLKKDIEKVITHFPDLKYIEDTNKTSELTGYIDIFDEDGEIYFDTFKIKIKIPKNYPYGFPTLYEIGDKIPKIADRHIFKDDNSSCVCVLQEISKESSKGITVFEYITKYVVPYLANQLYFEKSKKWANGDYKHGFEGILQYYEELLKSEDIDFIQNELNQFLHFKKNRNDICFCSSERKYKKCHLSIFTKLNNLTYKRVEKDFENLKIFIKIKDDKLKIIESETNSIETI